MAEQNFTDDELIQIANFEPMITDEERGQIEEDSSNQARAEQRRLCLAACARSAETLNRLRIEEPSIFADMKEAIEAFKEHTADLAKLSEAALTRMMIVGCMEEPSDTMPT